MRDYQDVIISTRIRLARNFEDIPFPNKMKNSPSQNNKIINVLKKVCDGYYDYEYKFMSTLNEIERLALLERHIISSNLVENTINGAVLLGKGADSGLSVMVNEEDHIRAQYLIKGFELEKAFRKISEFDDRLAMEANIAYNDKMGFLTACPTNMGTGMRASVMMFLPALSATGEIGNLINQLLHKGLTVRGAYGEGSKGYGYIYQISNQISCGVREEDILKSVYNAVLAIVKLERDLRDKLHKKQGIELEDEIMRSYGILSYALKINSQEFIEHISNVKLGVALGLIEGNMERINTLVELAQPANMCNYGGRLLREDERDELRAKLVRENIIKI